MLKLSRHALASGQGSAGFRVSAKLALADRLGICRHRVEPKICRLAATITHNDRNTRYTLEAAIANAPNVKLL
eukprot:6767607-Pyramimonas_sp.AAC.1